MRRALLVLALVLGASSAQATPEFENPNHTRHPCQMVQLRQHDGDWSVAHRPSEARRLFRKDPRPHRTVPLGDTRTYHDDDVPFIIRCLVREGPFNVPGGVQKAISVARCESGMRVSAHNGSYLGVYQMHINRFRDNALRGSSIYNAWAHVWAALRSATLSNWSGWACA